MAIALSVHRRLKEGTSNGYFVLVAFVIALSAPLARAETPDPQPPGPPPDTARPPLNPFPEEQNWSFLADARG